MPARPHTLYRFYDPDGTLLYVGITAEPGRRWKAHSTEKLWWTDVATVTVEHHTDRTSVLEAERAAIHAEKPLHNVVHNRGATLPHALPSTLRELNDMMLALVGAEPATGPFGSHASHMPDDCHDQCVKAGILAIYYPHRWHRGRAHYACQNGHHWTCGWGHQLSGDAPDYAGHPIDQMPLRGAS